MNTVLIGFGHKARNGKDTAVAAIVEGRSDKYDVRRYAFADELKREVNDAAEAAGGMQSLITRMHLMLELPNTVQYELNPDMTDPMCPLGKQRSLLQWWGTEHRRDKDPFYWVRKMALRIAEEKPQIAAIPDMRFPNEALWIKANEGYTVNIVRHGFRFSEGISEHVSETMLDGYNYDVKVTVGDGDVNELKRDALEAFDTIMSWCQVPEYTSEDFTAESFGAEEEGVKVVAS